jgi:site-specific DNA-methyltransferase (adenine-specific)
MTDVVKGKGWEMRLGRWENIAPDRVDHIIGDGPYDESTHAGHSMPSLRQAEYKGKHGLHHGGAPMKEGREAVSFDPIDPADVVPGLMERCRRWCVLFCSFQMLGDYRRAAEVFDGSRYARDGAWKKTNPMPQMSGDRPGQFGEAIAIMHAAGKMRWNGGGKAALWEHMHARGDERLVETPKPIALMIDLVRDFTDPGETILDPFAGSATTGVACMRTGRNFIGCECNEEVFQIAVQRLQAEERGLTLQASKAGQTSILDLVGGNS